MTYTQVDAERTSQQSSSTWSMRSVDAALCEARSRAIERRMRNECGSLFSTQRRAASKVLPPLSGKDCSPINVHAQAHDKQHGLRQSRSSKQELIPQAPAERPGRAAPSPRVVSQASRLLCAAGDSRSADSGTSEEVAPPSQVRKNSDASSSLPVGGPLHIHRPGVDEETLERCAERIQLAWRRSRDQVRFNRARRQLTGCSIASTPARSSSARSAHRAASVASASNTGSTGASSIGCEISEASWDEAASYRQPSVQVVLRSQKRWLEVCSGDQASQGYLDTLSSSRVVDIAKSMSVLERKLQLRKISDAPGAAWRPPCAVGSAACAEIEAQLENWRGEALRDDSTNAITVLLPCVCLFQLIVASSYLFQRNVIKARRLLASMSYALDSAPSGSYLCAVALQLHARIQLYLARASLLEGDLSGAVSATERALEFLSNRQGPRDFWPPHCWEFAGCHYIMASAFAGMHQYVKAICTLGDLSPLLTTAMSEAEPRLAASLSEDVRALKLECDVAQEIAHGSSRPEDLQRLLRGAQEMLANLDGLHARCCTLAVTAKIVLLQELPWYGASSSRPETLEAAAQKLEMATSGLSHPACLQKVVPLSVVCAALRGDHLGAAAQAAAWADKCEEAFGDDYGLSCHANQLAREISTAVQVLEDKPALTAIPGQAFQRLLRKAILATGAARSAPACRLVKQ